MNYILNNKEWTEISEVKGTFIVTGGNAHITQASTKPELTDDVSIMVLEPSKKQ